MHGFTVPARFFETQGESAGVILHQFVAFTVVDALFKRSNLIFLVVHTSQQRALALGGLNAILLHGDYLGTNLRELHRKVIGSCRDLCVIERLHCSFVRADALADARNDGHDVHKNSLSIVKGGVGASDSTLRGNDDGEGGHA